MNTYTTFPRHNPTAYSVEEHDIMTCPPDLWPMIKAYLARRASSEITLKEAA